MLGFTPTLGQVRVATLSLLHLAREELAANEEDVGQAPRLVDVANCLPCLRGSPAPLDVVKLTIHQVDANGGHGLLQASLVLLDDFGVCIGCIGNNLKTSKK